MRQTSIEAYKAILANGLLKSRQLEVYKCLYESGPMTQIECVRFLKARERGLTDHGYTPRFAELKDMGVIYEVQKRKCTVTGRRVIEWDVTDKLPQKVDKEIKDDFKVKIIKKDIFEAPIDVLVHQANCFHTMGSGIAAEIKRRFPEAYAADIATPLGDESKLGTYSFAKVKHNKIKYIINLYSQHNYGTNSRKTNYEAFYSGIESIKQKLSNHIISNKKDIVIGFPYKIGCGLGGGNWNIIQKMIEEVFVDYPSDVLICEKV